VGDDEAMALKIQLEVLTERVSNWMTTTTEYRKSLCSKLDSMNIRLDKLPCEARIEASKSIRSDLGWLQKIMYGVLGVGIPALLSLAVIWGAVRNDVEHLKNTSYGYRGIKVIADERGIEGRQSVPGRQSRV